ncbi:MAG: RsbRD N-terminal domain-containing protein [Desulfarculaceae bacterium]|jgi:hypothetical protein
MDLPELLNTNRAAILDRWFATILETYPAETAKFLKSQKDRFANPVGSTISREIEAIFDQLVAGNYSGSDVTNFLDRIIRIRAIQDFTPSQALAFIFQLKTVIREKLAKDIENHGLYAQMSNLETAIDNLALMAFDIFAACREKVYQTRTDEMKRIYAGALRRSGLFEEAEEPNHT